VLKASNATSGNEHPECERLRQEPYRIGEDEERITLAELQGPEGSAIFPDRLLWITLKGGKGLVGSKHLLDREDILVFRLMNRPGCWARWSNASATNVNIDYIRSAMEAPRIDLRSTWRRRS